MDSARLNDWLQVIGFFGVVASLTFVDLQTKQGTQIAPSAVFQARIDTTVQSRAKLAANSYLLPSIDKPAAGEELLPS